MAHNITQPSGSGSVALSLSEVRALYIARNGDTLDTNDLIPNTEGQIDFSPTTQVSRTRLHNGSDYVSSAGEQSQATTFVARMDRSNSKAIELEAARVSQELCPFNAFDEDGYGWAGFLKVTKIARVTEDAFGLSITVEPFGVEPIAPA